MAFYPTPSSAGTGIVVVPCVHPSVCPVPKDVTALNFKGYFRDLPEIHYCEAQYHDADCYSKWPCSVDFCAFHRTLKLSMISFHQVWGTAFQLKCKLFKDFMYRPEIWWGYTHYYEADSLLQIDVFGHFCAFHGTLKCSMHDMLGPGLMSEDEHLVTLGPFKPPFVVPYVVCPSVRPPALVR